MDNFKKAIAALTAIISMASLGVGTISASAADLDAINEKILNDTATEEDKVIASCTDSDEIKAMEYLIDSDTSIEDVQLAKQIYDVAIASDASSSVDLDFYNKNNIAETRHFAVMIDKKPKQAKNEYISVKVDKNIITSGINFSLSSPYNNPNVFETSEITTNRVGFTLNLVGNGIAVSSPKLMSIYQMTVSSKCKSEQELKDAMKEFDINGNNVIDFQTYARADVHRDGKISADDSMWILKYLSGTTDLLLTYNDGDDHCSNIVNLMAADVNMDGKITNDDVTLLNKYLVGSAIIN